MGMYTFGTGDRITVARINSVVYLLDGAAGGTDTITLIAGSELNMAACAPTSGLKLPSSAAAAPTAAGVLAYDSTDGSIAWGNGTSTVKPATNPMTAAADMIVGGTTGAQTRLPKGTADTFLSMSSGATSQVWRVPLLSYQSTYLGALTSLSTASWTSLMDLSLTTGVWLLGAGAHITSTATGDVINLRLWDAVSSNVLAETESYMTEDSVETIHMSAVLNLTTAATYSVGGRGFTTACFVRAEPVYNPSGSSRASWLWAVRIG